MKKLLNTLGLTSMTFLLTSVTCFVIGHLWNQMTDGTIPYDVFRASIVASIVTAGLWVLVFVYYLITTNARDLR